jgi:hypothetical protein
MSFSPFNNNNSTYFSFQQTLGEYIYFSPLTKGDAGRAVKIRKDLFLPFFCCVDPNTHDGQYIIRQIENLRTTTTFVKPVAGSAWSTNPYQSPQHLARLGKVNDGFQNVLVIKNLRVSYRVSQEQGDRAPCVYVTGVREVSRNAGNAPGLYESKTLQVRKVIEKRSNQQVDGQKVFINGSSQEVTEAMRSAQFATNDINSLLFYCPANVANDMGPFGGTTQTYVTQEAVNKLVEVFKQNQKPSRGVSWYVEGTSAGLLNEALKQIPGDLPKHEFRLINPIANTAKLLETLTAKKASFEGEFFKYDQNKAALISMSSQKDSLLQAIGKLPAGKNYDKITRSYIVKAINDLSAVGNAPVAQQQKLNSLTQTFVQLLRTAGVYR